MLSETQQRAFDQHLLVMRIINVSLAIGVGVFAGYLLLQGDPLVPFGSAADIVFLPPGLLAAVGGWLVLFVMPAVNVPPNAAQLAATNPEAHAVLPVLMGAQVRMIVACAVFEGGAFVSLAGFMLKHDPLYLAVGGVLLLFILLQFPRRGPLLDRVETRLRENKEARAMSGASR